MRLDISRNVRYMQENISGVKWYGKCLSVQRTQQVQSCVRAPVFTTFLYKTHFPRYLYLLLYIVSSCVSIKYKEKFRKFIQNLLTHS